jgi:putative polyhydroxyalkanoate system protein
MANITIKRQHTLGRERARERVNEIAKSLQKQLNTTCKWQGDSMVFSRSGASGSLDVGEETIEVNVKLGMMLSPMKGSIQQAIEEQIDQALS